MENESIEKKIDKIAVGVMKNAEAIKSLITREEFSEFKEENLKRLDKIINYLAKLDQERLFTFEAVKKIEKEVDEQHKEITQIKEILKIS